LKVRQDLKGRWRRKRKKLDKKDVLTLEIEECRLKEKGSVVWGI